MRWPFVVNQDDPTLTSRCILIFFQGSICVGMSNIVRRCQRRSGSRIEKIQQVGEDFRGGAPACRQRRMRFFRPSRAGDSQAPETPAWRNFRLRRRQFARSDERDTLVRRNGCLEFGRFAGRGVRRMSSRSPPGACRPTTRRAPTAKPAAGNSEGRPAGRADFRRQAGRITGI